MARDPVFDRQVAVAFQGAEAEIQRLFVAEINRQVGRVYSEARPSGHGQWIDGREGAPVESVSPFGVAVFEFRYLPEIVAFAANVLFANSPVDTHPKHNDIVFRESRLLFVDGVFQQNIRDGMAPSELRWLLDHPKGAEIIITDDEPYAGGLERGWSDQAPDGVYGISCGTVRRKYGNLVSAQFRWVRASTAPRGTPAMVIREL